MRARLNLKKGLLKTKKDSIKSNNPEYLVNTDFERSEYLIMFRKEKQPIGIQIMNTSERSSATIERAIETLKSLKKTKKKKPN